MVINWEDEPPREAMLQIVGVKVERPLVVCSAGKVQGVNTHYLEGKSRPCQCEPGLCWETVHQQPRWKGFMPGYLESGRKVGVEVTVGCLRTLPALRRSDIQGQWLRFFRKGPRNNGPLMVEVLLVKGVRQDAAWFDLRPSLLYMWGLPVDG